MRPRCVGCNFMKLTGRAKTNANNRGNSRGYCTCMHPKALEMFRVICPKSNCSPGFIAFTEMGGCVPTVKTSPRWCPLRLENKI